MVPEDLIVKDVPDDIVERLRDRAKANHQSLQDELLGILKSGAAMHMPRPMSFKEADRRIKSCGGSSPDQATAWIRKTRDALD